LTVPPGIVTDAIVTKIIESDLVVADLHGHNPNVMYEVAIRHATGDPIIQMIEEGEDLPFDIGGLNTIFYDPGIDALDSWRGKLRQAIEAVEAGAIGSNPVARASVFRALEAKGEPTEATLAKILRSVSNTEALVAQGREPTASSSHIGEKEWDLTFLAELSRRLKPLLPAGFVWDSHSIGHPGEVAMLTLAKEGVEGKIELRAHLTDWEDPVKSAYLVALQLLTKLRTKHQTPGE